MRQISNTDTCDSVESFSLKEVKGEIKCPKQHHLWLLEYYVLNKKKSREGKLPQLYSVFIYFYIKKKNPINFIQFFFFNIGIFLKHGKLNAGHN